MGKLLLLCVCLASVVRGVCSALVDGAGTLALDVEEAGLVSIPPPLITGPRSSPLYLCNVSVPSAGAPARYVSAYSSFTTCMRRCRGFCFEYAGVSIHVTVEVVSVHSNCRPRNR